MRRRSGLLFRAATAVGVQHNMVAYKTSKAVEREARDAYPADNPCHIYLLLLVTPNMLYCDAPRFREV
ncbi:hypothetical protein IP70_16840 [alpha proteobacterium AAP38]|nr:hypothetical protein IP70_16840 [alpha proteobacterium AAP38]